MFYTTVLWIRIFFLEFVEFWIGFTGFFSDYSLPTDMPTDIKSKTTRYWFEAVLTLLVIAESCIHCIRHISLRFCRPRYCSTPVLQSTLKTKRSRTFVWIYSVVEDVLGDIWLQEPHILQPSGLKFSLEEYTECDFRTTAVVFFPEIRDIATRSYDCSPSATRSYDCSPSKYERFEVCSIGAFRILKRKNRLPGILCYNRWRE